MTDNETHPIIRPGDWIDVGRLSCVVSRIYENESDLGVCEVVFNPEKPTNRDVGWDGGKWIFPECGDYGGYADKYQRLSTYVGIMKRGRNN